MQEEEVMDDDKVWAVVFRQQKKGAPPLPAAPCPLPAADPTRGCAEAEPEAVAAAANGLMTSLQGKVKVGCLDWKTSGVKELAGEFNVRKFNLPQVRIFVSRARSPSKAGMKGDEGELLPAADVRLSPKPLPPFQPAQG